MTQVVAEQRCSVRSVLAGEPMAGTAGHVHAGYLLIEEPGAWASKPFGGGALGGYGGEIETAAGQAGVKALLVRSSSRRTRDAATRRVYAASLGAPRRIVTLTVADPPDVLTLDLTAYARDLRELHPDAVEVTDPLLLVCTHAKRDQCCAIRGLPIARELSHRYPDRVLECSHLGGHRFAATALTLPSGAVYGRLSPALAARAYEAEHSGGVLAADLRGMSHLPPAAQVLDARLRARLDLPGVDDVRLLECTKQPGDTHLVRMTAGGVTWRAQVVTGRTAPKPPSCGKSDETSKVHSITALDAEP